MGMLISAPKKEAIDFSSIRKEVIAKLDMKAEFESLGVRFLSDTPEKGGWVQARAAGRADNNASASVNLQSGQYLDFTVDEKAISLFDLAIREGVYSDYSLAFNAYLEKTGVECKPINFNRKGEFTECSYEYFDPNGKLAYVIHRIMRKGGGKRFGQWRYLSNGEVQYNIKGYTPYPYHLPEILAADPNEIILIHEGEKAADRAMEAGFLSTTHNGGSNNIKVWEQLAPYFRDRDVVVIPDNDGPGITCMSEVAEKLNGVARSIRLLQLPRVPKKGDIVEFLDQCHGTAEELRDLINSAPTWEVGTQIHVEESPELHDAHLIVGDVPEAADDPDRLARVHLQRNHAHTEYPTCVRWKGDFHTWDGQKWKEVPKEEFEADLGISIKSEFDRVARTAEKPTFPMPVTTTVLGNVISATKRQTMLRTNLYDDQPAWLGPRKGDHPVEFLVPCKNGIVRIDMEDRGFPTVIPLTPRLFANYCLPFEYDIDAPSPENWLSVLNSAWPKDSESIETLQEWFAYMIVKDRRFQKMLFIQGPKRASKGTIINVMESIIGKENVHAGDMSLLGNRFGLWPMVTKSLVVFSEAELGKADRGVIVSRLKAISGGDTVSAERKNIGEPWIGKPNCRMVFTGNIIPTLSDKSLALAKRFIFLKLTKTYIDNEDIELGEKLQKELPGIFNWAIQGLYRLYDRGKFIQPQSGETVYKDFVGVSSSLDGFVEEHIQVTDPEHHAYLSHFDCVPARSVYDRWENYCKENGIEHVGSLNQLGRDLSSAIPTLVKKDASIKDGPNEKAKTKKCYFGITLKALDDEPIF